MTFFGSVFELANASIFMFEMLLDLKLDSNKFHRYLPNLILSFLVSFYE